MHRSYRYRHLALGELLVAQWSTSKLHVEASLTPRGCKVNLWGLLNGGNISDPVKKENVSENTVEKHDSRCNKGAMRETNSR